MPVVPPQSPPKRMTRARAKAVEEEKPSIKRAAIKTPAAKAVAKNNKRKTRADDEGQHEEEEIQEQGAAESKPKRATKTPITRKAAAVGTRNNNKRQNANVSTRDETTRNLAKDTNNSSKKEAQPGEPNMGEETIQEEPPARSTRARAGRVGTTAASRAKAGAPKKKVTFQDVESEKENIVEPKKGKRSMASGSKLSDEEKTGLKAKPVRKPANRTEAKRKAGEAQGGNEEVEASTIPLSPKKNVQVGATKSTEEFQNHLAGITLSPIKPLQRSPTKPSTNEISKQGPRSPVKAMIGDSGTSVDELQESGALFTSPKKGLGSMIQGTPAKRPAPSPFKDTLKESPKKFGPNLGQSIDNGASGKLTDSVLSRPPKRMPLTEPPKQPLFDATKREGFKSSLLGSPAKRPPSPTKDLTRGSAFKHPATTASSRIISSSGISATPRKLTFSPTKTVSSAFRSAQAPEASHKVYRMTTEEQRRMLQDELKSAPSPILPVKKTEFAQQPAEDIVQKSAITPFKEDNIGYESKEPGNTPISQAEGNNKSPMNLEDASFPQQEELPTQRDHHIEEEYPASDQSGLANDQVLSVQSRAEVLFDGDESEDELQSDTPAITSPSRARASASLEMYSTPIPSRLPRTPKTMNTGSMTALAQKFGQWRGATPEPNVLEQRRTENSVFSPIKQTSVQYQPQNFVTSEETQPVEQTSQFEEALMIREDEDASLEELDHLDYDQQNEDCYRESQTSEESAEFGDENVPPVDSCPANANGVAVPSLTCTPARVFSTKPNILHTVTTKVPLKPAADEEDSPIARTTRRTQSLGGPTSPKIEFNLEGPERRGIPLATKPITSSDALHSVSARSSKLTEVLAEDQVTPEKPSVSENQTPVAKAGTGSVVATPAQTPRPGLDSKLLSGVVVFVDVHTTEGADASGIFVELLTQMGARCVKQWNWNPRNSFGPVNTVEDSEEVENSKVGITHVVFKDGGKRTMEKVREARGLVLCVGVGWVLDCERENKWLDETDYAIDTSTIPRGGHRRRKSMEPKMLADTTNLFSPVKAQEVLSPSKEYLNLSSPSESREKMDLSTNADRRVSFAPITETIEPSTPETQQDWTPKQQIPSDNDFSTPTQRTPKDFSATPSMNFSPATPYFLHHEQLEQQTCPPKQTQQSFFPVSGNIEDQPDENLRKRLLMARRRSLQFRPRIGSPLAKGVESWK